MRARGLTLVEVVIALLVLSIGALAVAGGITHAERARSQAFEIGLALAAAESWLETWRAGPWKSTGESGVENQIHWRTSVIGHCLIEARVRAVRSGSRPGPDGHVVLVTRRFKEEDPLCG